MSQLFWRVPKNNFHLISSFFHAHKVELSMLVLVFFEMEIFIIRRLLPLNKNRNCFVFRRSSTGQMTCARSTLSESRTSGSLRNLLLPLSSVDMSDDWGGRQMTARTTTLDATSTPNIATMSNSPLLAPLPAILATHPPPNLVSTPLTTVPHGVQSDFKPWRVCYVKFTTHTHLNLNWAYFSFSCKSFESSQKWMQCAKGHCNFLYQNVKAARIVSEHVLLVL